MIKEDLRFYVAIILISALCGGIIGHWQLDTRLYSLIFALCFIIGSIRKYYLLNK